MHALGLRRLGLLLLLPALALRCGGAAPEPSHRLSERTSTLLASAPVVYAPGAVGQSATRDSEAIRATFEAALAPEARARLRHDPALDLVAAVAADSFTDQGRPPSRPLLQWMFWRAGSLALYHDWKGGFLRRAGPSRRSAPTMRADLDQLEIWARSAAQHINETPTSTLEYGLARFTEGRVTSEAIVFGWSVFEVPSFSKTYAPGAPLTLALRPRRPLAEIRFLLDRGDAIEEQNLAPQPDGSFFVSQAVPTRPGRYFLEIQGPGPSRATLLTVPIYVGVPEPTAPDDFIQKPPAGPPDLAGWPAWLAATYDAERARLGRSPVVVDARLSAIAADQAALLAVEQQPFAVRGPARAASLAMAGFRPPEVAETVLTAQATDSVLLHLLRPSVRQRMVLSERLELGAGAALRSPRENQPASYTLVQETMSPR